MVVTESSGHGIDSISSMKSGPCGMYTVNGHTTYVIGMHGRFRSNLEPTNWVDRITLALFNKINHLLATTRLTVTTKAPVLRQLLLLMFPRTNNFLKMSDGLITTIVFRLSLAHGRLINVVQSDWSSLIATAHISGLNYATTTM